MKKVKNRVDFNAVRLYNDGEKSLAFNGLAEEISMRMNEVDINLGGGSLLQVANRSPVQMMSYFIETPEGKTVVIDGGNYGEQDAEHLHELIIERGGVVDQWIISHAHEDHYGALSFWLERHEKLDFEIKEMYFSFPPIEWFKGVENGNAMKYLPSFLEQLELHGIKHEELKYKDVIECGGMSFEVLNDNENYNEFNTINDTTIVFKARFPKRDVLFLGDLGLYGGKYLIKHFDATKLRCDVVQMAHHGQNGADKEFYEYISPKLCLYTAPDWLWTNDAGDGFGTGPWKTLETRRWMEELGVVASFPIAYGDYLFK